MCTIISKCPGNEMGHVYVADRPLVCYKYVCYNGEWVSPLYNKQTWEEGKEYETELSVSGEEKMFDFYLYWIYDNPRLVKRTLDEGMKNDYLEAFGEHNCNINERPDLFKSGKGFYSFTNFMNGAMEEFKRISPVDGIMRCEIPVGSRYMVSDDGMVFISERLKCVENIKSLKRDN